MERLQRTLLTVLARRPTIGRGTISSYSTSGVQDRCFSRTVLLAKVQQNLPFRISSIHLCRRFKSGQDLNALFVPVQIEPVDKREGTVDVGEEFAGKLNRDSVLVALNTFYRRPEIKRLGEEHGLDSELVRLE
jgi:Suv3 helical N-terminal domain